MLPLINGLYTHLWAPNNRTRIIVSLSLYLITINRHDGLFGQMNEIHNESGIDGVSDLSLFFSTFFVDSFVRYLNKTQQKFHASFWYSTSKTVTIWLLQFFYKFQFNSKLMAIIANFLKPTQNQFFHFYNKKKKHNEKFNI